MKRKIVQHGTSSLTITLPFNWVNRYKLKKGEELEVEERGPILEVSTRKDIAADKKEVNTTDFGYFTKNNLTHLYQLGYDEIEIRFEDEKMLRELKDRVPECVGFEIIDQKPNKILVKSIASALESEFDTLLRKSFLITNEMAKAVLEALEKKEFSKLKEIRHQEFLNNKFTMTCARILNKRGYSNPKRTLQMYEIVKQLERIADHYKYICDLFSNYNKRINKDILNYFKEANEYYYNFYQIFYKFDPEFKEITYKDRVRLLRKGEELLKKSRNRESILIHYLLSLIRIIYDTTGAYFALIL